MLSLIISYLELCDITLPVFPASHLSFQHSLLNEVPTPFLRNDLFSLMFQQRISH